MDKVVLGVIFAMVAVTLIAIASMVSVHNSPCSELGNLSVQDLPSRCLKELK